MKRNIRYKKLLVYLCFLPILIFYATGCNDDTPGDNPFDYGLITSAVVVVNPVINQGSSTPVQSGSIKANVSVTADNMNPVFTDSSGLVVIKEIPVGLGMPLKLDSGSVSLDVIQEKELYDCVISMTYGTVQYIFPPVRYPIYGTSVKYLEPGDDIIDYIADDNSVVVLAEGKYPGNIEIRAENVLIFGAWSQKDGPLSIIRDSITVLGEGTRMRGLSIKGGLSVTADNFEAAFCDFEYAYISGDNVMLLRNEFTVGQATVPSSSAILVDNKNIP